MDKYNIEVVQTPRNNNDIEILGFCMEGFKTGVTLYLKIYRPPKGDVENALRALQLKLVKGESTFILDPRKDTRMRSRDELMKISFPRNERFRNSICYIGPSV